MPIAETSDTKYAKRERTRKAHVKLASKLGHKRFKRKLKAEKYFQRKSGQLGLILALSTLIESEC